MTQRRIQAPQDFVAGTRTPEGLKKLVESEVARWNKVLKDAGAASR